MDWLVVWGVTQVTGALVKPVLEDFAKDVVNDSAKDYVKNCFGNVFKSLQKDAHQNEPATLACLLDRAVMDESPAEDAEDRGYEYSVRDTALRLLAQYWPEHAETLQLLKSRQQDDPTPWLREKAKRLADEIEARRKQQ
jgi:hypothetical protein